MGAVKFRPRTKRRICAACGRKVISDVVGNLVIHGPGTKGEFVCPGSGDKAMVRAARGLHVG